MQHAAASNAIYETESALWQNRAENLLAGLEADDSNATNALVRSEVDRRLRFWVVLISFGALFVWAGSTYHLEGTLAVGALAFVYTYLSTWLGGFDPKRDRHLIGLRAQDMNRLFVLAEIYEAGEQTWIVTEPPYPGAKRTVQIPDSWRWNTSWERVHSYILMLKVTGPYGRDRLLLRFAKRARVPLEQGRDLAKREGADLTSWAKDHLYQLSNK